MDVLIVSIELCESQAECAIMALNCSGMILGTLPVRHDPPSIPVHFVFKIEKS
jgi:hypothetical protein